MYLGLIMIVNTVSAENSPENQISVCIEWHQGSQQGSIALQFAQLDRIEIIQGKGSSAGNRFAFESEGPCRLKLVLSQVTTAPGPRSTLITVNRPEHGFSFFLRDVTAAFPVIIPAYQVCVLPGSDLRSYDDVLSELHDRGLKTKLEIIAGEEEETFAHAAQNTRDQPCPTWLGLARDFRLFEVDFGLGYYDRQMETIRPKWAARQVTLPELDDNPVTYHFVVGRGIGTSRQVVRRLDEGFLPILHTDILDEDILYQTCAFVALERSPLTQKNLRGTHYLVADGYSGGHMFTADQQLIFDRLEKAELIREEEIVLFFQAKAINESLSPKYAYFKMPAPALRRGSSYTFTDTLGFSSFNSGRIFCLARLNGQSMPFEEISILLQPGETAEFEFALPHAPLSPNRAKMLARRNFDEILRSCREFWRQRLSTAARISLPEPRIEEMIKAGLLHLDLITDGLEPQGTLAPKIGVYSPIGSESSPIIQFMISMGWHETAKRSLQYFLDKQHEDGLIQNFGGYMLETGAALWSMGEYFRYTHDSDWLEKNREKILKACQYLLDWRNRNKREELRGRGYGMIDGKVADPEDPFHSYMLNGYGYLGISRAAEMLKIIAPQKAAEFAAEASAWRQNIRESYFASEIRSPLIPLSDGSWSPTAPPWPEAPGPLLFYINPEKQYTHGTFTARDAMLGPLYLVFQEVIDPHEPAAGRLLDYHTDNFYLRNTAFSQPYYSRHAWLELKRGLIKPFLKTYYNTFAGLADRETYTFWEHYYHVSPHKTHEEGWFLMQTRWLLWMENGDTLQFLAGIPRAWLAQGNRIELENISTYFGSATLRVVSYADEGWIEAEVRVPENRKPRALTIRLPHPKGRKIKRVSGADCRIVGDTLVIGEFGDRIKLHIEY